MVAVCGGGGDCICVVILMEVGPATVCATQGVTLPVLPQMGDNVGYYNLNYSQ